MGKGWTPERRARQAERIRQWKPWEKSTGPRTEAGKAASNQNALVHGERSAEVVKARKQFNDVMRSSRAIIDRLKEAGREAVGEIREMRQQDDKL